MRLEEYPDNSGIATANDFSERIQPEALASGSLAPALKREGRLLLRLGIGKPLIARAVLNAQHHGTSVEQELLAAGGIDETIYYEALAEMLGLEFIPAVDPARVQDIAGLDTQLVRPEMLRIHHASRPPVTVMIPKLERLEDILGHLQRLPSLRHSLAVSTPSAIRAATWQAGAARRVTATTRALFENTPMHSARVTVWGRQGFYAGICLSAAAIAAISIPLASILALHIVLTLFFMAQLFLRLYALGGAFEPRQREQAVAIPLVDETLPIYTVMVALYREKAVARQLVQALDELDWPRSRLDIKLVCEADDEETIAALSGLSLAPEYEILRVPVHMPRTKPKALTYALSGVRGMYLTVYDAEDRPHPQQLREAHAAFLAAPAHVICLQAPLVVTNARQSWLSSLFAIEYAALFRGLLPMLSANNLPMPLGGTSNHFKTAELKQIGAWDPFNMTEDADLGMRLHRLGYRSRVIYHPTLEEAPTTLRVWIAQRTRWFKGWLQTWLVLMRQPVQLRRQIGWPALLVFHILIGGMLLSSLSHPVILAFVAYLVWVMMTAGTYTEHWLAFWLFVCDITNIFGSYAAFLALGRKRMSNSERKAIGLRWTFVPAYWIVTSLAAWRALIELKTSPFSWNKTPHLPVRAQMGKAHPPADAQSFDLEKCSVSPSTGGGSTANGSSAVLEKTSPRWRLRCRWILS